MTGVILARYLALCVILAAHYQLEAKILQKRALEDGPKVFSLNKAPIADSSRSARLRRSAPSSNPPASSQQKNVSPATKDENDKLIVNVTKFQDPTHNQAIVHWSGNNSNVIFILTRQQYRNGSVPSSRLYWSQDYGLSFKNKTIDKNNKAAVVTYYHASSQNKDKLLFVDKKAGVIYITKDEGKTFTKTKVDFALDKLVFHPTMEDWVLCYAENSRVLKASFDFGDTWDHVADFVNPRFFWGDDENDNSSTVVHTEVLDPTTGKFMYNAYDRPYGKPTKTFGPIDVESLLVQKEYIFVQKTTRFQTWLYVSHQRRDFRMANFPRNHHPKDINVINADEHQVFIEGTNRNSYATLYLSDTNGLLYVTSLDKVLIDDAGLYEVKGLPAVYFANQGAGPSFRTLISFDRGGRWDPIPAPDTDAAGKPTNCTKNCTLHFHLGVIGHSLVPYVVSETNAPGIIFAEGVLGKVWSQTQSTILFRSSDGGYTWQSVFKGYFHVNILDQGAAMVGVQETLSNGPTSSIHFSSDEGSSWKKHTFLKDPIRVDAMLNEPGISTLVVIVFGHDNKNKGWDIVMVNFTGLLPNKCTDTDYHDWHLEASDKAQRHQCLLGRKWTYKRRNAKSTCYNGRDYSQPEAGIDQCACTWEDYECDYGYHVTADYKCKVALWFNASQPVGDCPEGDMYNQSSGFRKVASDVCNDTDKNILDKTKPKLTSCPIMRPQGLHLDVVGHTIVPTGKPVQFELVQERGSKKSTTYSWNYGDVGGSSDTLMQTGYALGHKGMYTYNKIGTYTVKVVAKNSVGSNQVSTSVIVQDEIKGIYVDTPHGAQINKPVLYEVTLLETSSLYTYNNGKIHYLWTFGDEAFGEDPLITWSSRVNHTYTKAHNYTVFVEAMNGLGSSFERLIVPVYGTLKTVKLLFDRNTDLLNQQHMLWRRMFARTVRDFLLQTLNVNASRLEVVVPPRVPTTVDVSILPLRQTSTADATIEPLLEKLLTLANSKTLVIHLSKRNFDMDANATVVSAVVITDDEPVPQGTNYTAVYICVPILVAAIFVSVLVILYYKKSFNQHQRRYTLLQNQSEQGDSLLDDTDDDDPPINPNPDVTNQRLALSDDDLDDPLGLLGSPRTVQA